MFACMSLTSTFCKVPMDPMNASYATSMIGNILFFVTREKILNSKGKNFSKKKVFFSWLSINPKPFHLMVDADWGILNGPFKGRACSWSMAIPARKWWTFISLDVIAVVVELDWNTLSLKGNTTKTKATKCSPQLCRRPRLTGPLFTELNQAHNDNGKWLN